MRDARLSLALVVVLTGGCATLPDTIATPPPGDLQLVEALRAPGTHRGTPVRWGGTVLDSGESAGVAWVEILERKLDDWGRPQHDSPSDGRFVVRLGKADGRWPRGYDVTVAGVLEDERETRVGSGARALPVVHAQEHFLWAPRRPHYYPPFHGPYPLFGHHHRGFHHFGLHDHFGFHLH